MAVFSIDFSGEATGSPPANFTSRWTATGQTWAVREKSGELGGKGLEHVRTTTARRLFSWDTPGTTADGELLVRWRSTSAISADQFWLTIRGAGSAGAETGYIFRNTSGTSIQLSRVVAGTLTTIGSAVTIPSLVSGEWFWMRFRVNGTDLKAKIWAGEHLSEPAAWTIERTDTNIVAAGWLGVGNAATTGTRDYDDIAAGTSGSTAAFPVSTEARVTQAAALILDAPVADVRVTQTAMLALAFQPEGSEELRVTQATALALAEFEAGVRVTQLATLVLADQVNCLTKWAQTWTITRVDGEVRAFTSHDMPVIFRGVSHSPCNSLMATAVELSTAMGTSGSQDLMGLLSDVGVSEEDIYNGLYDGAFIESWMVPWDNAGGEIPFRLMGGVIGSAGFGELTFNQEVLSDSARLGQTALLETYTPACRYLFGSVNDSRCPVDLSALQVSGSVTGTAIPNASTSSTRRIFTDSTRVESDGFFDFGVITWTSGANAGATSEIKDFAAGQFIIWDVLLFPIALGDTYTATPGCDKSTADHLVFNADLVDFGGFPDVPGNDSILQSPDAKG